MDDFAKLFNTPNGQLLVIIDNDGDEAGPRLTIRAASIEGVSPQISHGPWPDNAADWKHVESLLADFDQDQANSWAEKLSTMVRNLLTQEDTQHGE